VEQLTSGEAAVSDFTAKTNLIRAIWGGSALKIVILTLNE
jgi:hypothetical protein